MRHPVYNKKVKSKPKIDNERRVHIFTLLRKYVSQGNKPEVEQGVLMNIQNI